MLPSVPSTVTASLFRHTYETISSRSTESDIDGTKQREILLEKVEPEFLILDQYYAITIAAEKICTMQHFSQKSKNQPVKSEVPHSDEVNVNKLIFGIKSAFQSNQYMVLISHLNKSILIEKSIADTFCENLASDNGYKLIRIDNSKRNSIISEIEPCLWAKHVVTSKCIEEKSKPDEKPLAGRCRCNIF